MATEYGLERRHLLFFMDIGSREVRCGGIAHNPDSNWTTQIARNMCDMWDGFLLGKRYLIHDRDPVFNKRFDMIFESIGIEIKKLPPFTPANMIEFQNKELKKRTRLNYSPTGNLCSELPRHF